MSDKNADYQLDGQIGFLLRKAHQRHTTLFANLMPGDLTPTQFAALNKLFVLGPTSQNLLGRETAMDAATIKGVVGRLVKRGLALTKPDTTDRRRLIVSLSDDGEKLVQEAIKVAIEITEETLKPLSAKERAQLLPILLKLG